MQEAVFRHTSNCTVVSAGSGPDGFRAIFNNPDLDIDRMVTASMPELRYPSAQALSRGDAITINGAAFVVAEVPRRIGAGGESVVAVEPA